MIAVYTKIQKISIFVYMTISTPLIVLNTTKVGDSSLVVHALSPTLGRRSYIVSVGKKGGQAQFQPLNILNAEAVENPKSDLWRLKGISSAHPLSGIRSNMYKNSMTLFMAEVLFRTVRGDAEPGLYEWCERGILTLDALQSDFANYHLRWLLELCGALGFTPSPEDLAPFAGEHLRDIQGLMGPFEESLLVPLTGQSRSEIADSLLQYLSAHLETRLNIRSLGVLSELYR